MNEYGFDYMNYITNIPSNMMDMNNKFNVNQMNNMNNSSSMMNNFYMNNSNKMMDKNKTVDPYLGFIRGNLFEKLYDQYKNYKPQEIDAKDEREALLYQLMQYKFALIELNLYLDTNPNDKEMLELYNKYLGLEKQICNK